MKILQLRKWSKMKNLLKKLWDKLTYEIELVTQLLVVFITSWTYGIIEANYIPTDNGNFAPLPGFLHQWSYYHLYMCIILITSCFSLAISHIKWLVGKTKQYVLLMAVAAIPLALMIEDIAWFVTRWRPIKRDEWTMITPGLGIDIGFTWIPLWYIVSLVVSIILYAWASNLAGNGYKAFLEKSKDFKDITSSLTDKLRIKND